MSAIVEGTVQRLILKSAMQHAPRLAGLAMLLLTASVNARAQQAGTPPAVIAVHPTLLPLTIPRADTIGAVFDSLITSALASSGYAIVPCSLTADAWKKSVDSLGGYYDRVTGKVVQAKFRAACAAAVARLRPEHRAEALLTPIIEVHPVRADGGVARWEGVTQRVDHMGWSTVNVFTLRVFTTDSAGAPLHCGSGGIHALVKYSAWSGPRPLPPDEYFRDRERNVAAVGRALASLLARAPVCELH